MLGASLGAASGCRSSDVASPVRPQLAWVAEAASIVPAEIQALARPQLARTERLIHSVTKAFPLRGQTVYRLVAFDEVTQATRKFAVDAAGAIVDFESLVKQEQATYRARDGVLDEALQARLLRSTATREAVEIRYRPTGHPPLRPASGALLSEAAHEAALNAFIGPNASTLAEEIIADGGRVISRNRYAPIIEAELPPALLLGKYKTHPLIEAIVRSGRGDPVVRGEDLLGLICRLTNGTAPACRTRSASKA